MQKFYSPSPNSPSSTGESRGVQISFNSPNPLSFRDELIGLLNRHNKDTQANTPDFVLAKFVTDTLIAFDRAMAARDELSNGQKKGG